MIDNTPHDGNKEMISFGLMNLFGSFTSCYLTSGTHIISPSLNIRFNYLILLFIILKMTDVLIKITKYYQITLTITLPILFRINTV